MRILFVFDPRRAAVLLLGGNYNSHQVAHWPSYPRRTAATNGAAGRQG